MFLMQIITLTTDFGNVDHYVGALKGVICNIYPYSKIVDITHNISPQNISQANYVIENAYRYFPQRTIHVCVIDPGVGGSRKPILIETKNYYFIGPNNGIFTSVLEQEDVVHVIELTKEQYWLHDIKGTVSTSSTFHGRDIFAPIAAHLAKGIAVKDFGESLNKDELVKLPVVNCERNGKKCVGLVKYIDHFGNIITNIPDSFLSQKIQGKIKGTDFKGMYLCYTEGELNKLASIKSSNGYLEIFVNKGSAAKVTNAKIGDKVEIKFL